MARSTLPHMLVQCGSSFGPTLHVRVLQRKHRTCREPAQPHGSIVRHGTVVQFHLLPHPLPKWSKELRQYPQVAPISEAYPGVELTGWFVIAAPNGTPAAIVARLNQEMDEILKDPKMAKKLADLGFLTEGAQTPAATTSFVRAQYNLWGKVTREIGLKPE